MLQILLSFELLDKILYEVYHSKTTLHKHQIKVKLKISICISICLIEYKFNLSFLK